MIYPGFVDHLVFRVSDLARTERFYTALLGEPAHRTEDSVMFIAGDTRLFFTLPGKPEPQRHDKENVGLNHVAFGVRTIEELRTVEAQLDAAGIAHSGIRIDRYGQREFIWMDDPDGIRLEFYLRAEPGPAPSGGSATKQRGSAAFPGAERGRG